MTADTPTANDAATPVPVPLANPLLAALHQIADLGSCGGKAAKLQNAIDIAINAICAHDTQTEN
jgi:hypothetical protein